MADEEILLTENNEIDRIADELSVAVKGSRAYKEYQKWLNILKEDSELYAKVNQIRRKNFEMQNQGSEAMRYETFSEIFVELNRIKENEIVAKFLEAELGFCRLIQEIKYKVSSVIDFDDDFLK